MNHHEAYAHDKCSSENESERQYINGRDAALRGILLYCASMIGIFAKNDPMVRLAYLIDERARTVKALRELCETLGCNDWPDNLDLGDIIEKHLARTIEDMVQDGRGASE